MKTFTDIKPRQISYEYEHKQLFALCMLVAGLLLVILK